MKIRAFHRLRQNAFVNILLSFWILSFLAFSAAPPADQASSPQALGATLQNQPAQTPQLSPPGPFSRAHAFLESGPNCLKCHSEGKAISSKNCLACHQPVADRMAQKKGVHRDITGDCEVCHVEHKGRDGELRPPLPKDFDHGEETGFALTGMHARRAQDCAFCHTSRSFLENNPECFSCHADPHQGAMLESCNACHDASSWASVSRAFHKSGRFPLEGRHLATPCQSCHLNGAVKGTPDNCYDCHWVRRQDDLYRTRLGSECAACHRPTAWTAVKWDHAAETGVGLNASHRTFGCDSCHKDQDFKAKAPDCFSCHAEDFAETEDPDHRAAGFPTACELCHLPSHTSFRQARFNHSDIFPLQGEHLTLSCSECHAGGRYAGTPRDCYSCHQSDYEMTKDPPHAASGFPFACDACHKSNDPDWHQAKFNHSAVYPLQGVHASQGCAVCHVNNIYRGTQRQCIGCHKSAYDRTRDPSHVAAGFSTICESCHQPSDPDWNRARFNHSAAYPLVGVHATVSCNVCHFNNVYKGTQRECFGCHKSAYDQTRNPNHAAAGYSTVCDSCHQPTDPDWNRARFNHAAAYPLVGVHATVSCNVCHINNVYKGTPRDCYGCHRTNYDGTRNPNHRAAGYPTACDSCHRATDPDWNRAVFSHPWFPITSGRHAGNSCSACHPDANNYKAFTCLTCHTRSDTDNEHRGRAGYLYDSATCLVCHPQGRTI